MTKRALISALGLLCLSVTAARAEPEDHAGHHGHAHGGTERPDSYAPIGVMGDHLHHAGGWMVSYRYMRMRMDGNRIGTDDVGVRRILRPDGTYGAAPLDMDMDMHMLGLMYAPHARITLMAMLPFVVQAMDHRTAMGTEFTTRSSGVADFRLSGLVGLFERESHRSHLQLGFSFPTGSIDKKDNTPASGGSRVVLPYPMQIGSGTVDLLPGITYRGEMERFSWGTQVLGTVRLHRNEEDYRLGNRYTATGWAAAKMLDWLSGAVRLEWRHWFNIRGDDDRLGAPPPFPDAASFIPTADPSLQAGRRLDIGPSVNLLAIGGAAKGVRLGVEAMFPTFEDLSGPQLSTDWTVTAGLQYSF